MQNDLNITDSVEALLKDAARHFPTLTITSEISTLANDSVLRITHHAAINNQHSWIAIVLLTTLWKSEYGTTEVKATPLIWVLMEYGKIVNQAIDLGLFKLSDFKIATNEDTIKTDT